MFTRILNKLCQDCALCDNKFDKARLNVILIVTHIKVMHLLKRLTEIFFLKFIHITLYNFNFKKNLHFRTIVILFNLDKIKFLFN